MVKDAGNLCKASSYAKAASEVNPEQGIPDKKVHTITSQTYALLSLDKLLSFYH